MAIWVRQGRTAYGAGVVKARETFVPEPLRLFNDPILIDLLPARVRFVARHRWVREFTTARRERGAPGVRGWLLCRVRYFDDAVTAATRRGLRTVVILGAGLDTRAYRLPELAGLDVFEVDLPWVQKSKKMRLKRLLGALPATIRYVPLDFNTGNLELALAGAGLDAKEPTIFLLEGVIQYLQPEAVHSILRIVAARPNGTELVFSYTQRKVADPRRAQRMSEPWHFLIDPSELQAFLARRGLVLREDVGPQDLIERYLRPLGRELTVADYGRIARAVVE